jgi:2-keto-4-pentenoate hydratase
MNEAEITGAAAALAAARNGPAIAGLSPAPQTLAEAEAIQMATLAAMGMRRGGWKLGRANGIIFSAPMPAGPIDEAEPVLTLPSGTRIELEIALRFRAAPPPAPLTPEALPELTDLVVLFEFVRTRLATPPAVLDRIADCVSNDRVVAVTAPGPWSVAILEKLPRVQLLQDDVEIAAHQGTHPAAPLEPLLAAWDARRAGAGLSIAAGEVLTLGSLTGVLPVPEGGVRYLGRIGDLPPVRCCVRAS